MTGNRSGPEETHCGFPAGAGRVRHGGFLLAGPGIEKPQPRPMKGILVAMIVMNCTLTSIGRLAM